MCSTPSNAPEPAERPAKFRHAGVTAMGKRSRPRNELLRRGLVSPLRASDGSARNACHWSGLAREIANGDAADGGVYTRGQERSNQHAGRFLIEPDICGRSMDGRCELPVELSSDVAFETSPDLARRPAFLGTTDDVGRGLWVFAHAYKNDGVDCGVELAVPPRLRRCLTVRPEDASIGLTPASEANAASDRTRPGCDQRARRLRSPCRSRPDQVGLVPFR